jgi:hypothetical protein
MDQDNTRDNDLEVEAKRLATIIPIYLDLYQMSYSISHIASMIKRDYLLKASLDEVEVLLAPAIQEENDE